MISKKKTPNLVDSGTEQKPKDRVFADFMMYSKNKFFCI